jgi:hypothetical protein
MESTAITTREFKASKESLVWGGDCAVRCRGMADSLTL